MAHPACPQLDRSVEHEPDDVALLDLVLSNQQLTAARGGFPGDTLEWISGLILADLAELGRLTAAPGRADTHQHAAARQRRVPPERRTCGQHLETEGVAEGERHLE